MAETKALKILRRAASYIKQGRWYQGNFRSDERRINVKTGKRVTHGKIVQCYCAAGALQEAAGYYSSDGISRAQNLFLRAIRKSPKNGAGEEDIWEWNDRKWRTIGQVRKAFDRAIELARKAA